MKVPPVSLASSLALVLSATLSAAPSLRLPREWAAPLDSAKAVVLVETETGQTRMIRFEGTFEGIDSGPKVTNLPGITGLNTGLQSDGIEHLILSSTTANGVRLFNTNDFSVTSFQPDAPGPITAIPLRRLSGDPAGLHQLSAYGDSAEVLQRYTDILSPNPTPDGRPFGNFPVYDLQPTRIPGSPDLRAGIASIASVEGVNLYEVRAEVNGATYTHLAGGGTPGEKIATGCRGSDGRLCVLRYQPSATDLGIVTQPYFGFPVGSATSNVLPFKIGSIMAVPPSVPGAPHGVVITALDGSGAAYAHIDLGTTLSIQAIFKPDEGNILTGLVPIPGHGLLLLEGPLESQRSTSWTGYRENRGNWEKVNGNTLEPWLPAQTNFATLFWFKGIPLVEPGAEIIKLETRGDWTRKTSNAAIPAQIELSALLTAEQGLTPFSREAPGSIPAGANYLLTSQRENQVSITALDTDLALQTPSVSLSPPSGNYDNPVTLTALFDDDSNELFFREDRPGSPWRPFTTQTISYPSGWLFYARNLNTGIAGPILRRDFTVSGINPNSFDSDNDGVPDYVERHLGLDPAGGADSDGDFQSDLEEIFANKNPADPESNLPPGDPRDPPFLGEGFELIAQAFNASGQGASPANEFNAATREDDFPGETLRAFDLHGNLLAEENVVELMSPPPLAGQNGALMQIGTVIEEAAWITLVSPTTFGVLDVPEPPRTGREVIKVMQRPLNPVAEVVTVPGGTDRDADAEAWIAAAIAAHESHETISSLTELRPVDNALSALAEQALYSSLMTLDLADRLALGVPTTIDEFTLFPQRSGESSKVVFSADMWAALRAAGCDFPALLAALEPATADANVLALANQLTALHASDSESHPLMALPLDVFRSIIRTGTIEDPAPGDPARPNPYVGIPQATVDTVKAAFDALLGQVPFTKRPVETWFLVIGPSTTPLHHYDYVRQGTSDKVWLSDRNGERILLEQGLGLAHGTVYEISGFTDAVAPAGFLGFEPIKVESIVAPLASDSDSNGNLLDDGWENVFFGKLGAVGPYDPHPVTGHSYLQYHLTGSDPRSGTLAGPVVTISPVNLAFEWVPAADTYDLQFDFPAEFFDQFNFILQASSTLEDFAGPADQGGVQTVSPGRYSFRIQSEQSNLSTNFFRIGLSLK